MTRKEIKERSKRKIKGNMWNMLRIIVLANLISGITVYITTENELISLIISIGGEVLAFFMEI